MSDELLAQVASTLGDSEKSVAALGALFTSLRLSVDPTTFAEIKHALPRVESWMGLALAGGGGRTGEFLALVGNKAIERNLAGLGLSAGQIAAVASAVSAELKTHLSPQAFEQVTAKVPILRP